jgi:hypothetical protein
LELLAVKSQGIIDSTPNKGVAMAKKQSIAQMKKRGERMYLRMAVNERGRRWAQISDHIVSVMLTGKLAFNPRTVLRAEAKEIAAEKAAEKAAAKEVTIPADPDALYVIPCIQPTNSIPASGFDYEYTDGMDSFKFHPVPTSEQPSEPMPDFPQD